MFSMRHYIFYSIFGQRSKMVGQPKNDHTIVVRWLLKIFENCIGEIFLPTHHHRRCTFDCEFWAFISPFIVNFLKTTLYDRASIFNLN